MSAIQHFFILFPDMPFVNSSYEVNCWNIDKREIKIPQGTVSETKEYSVCRSYSWFILDSCNWIRFLGEIANVG